MHDWHGVQSGLIVLFVVLPALAGGAAGYLLSRRANRTSGHRVLSVLIGAVTGIVLSLAALLVILRY